MTWSSHARHQLISELKDALVNLPNLSAMASQENVHVQNGGQGLRADAVLRMKINGRQTILLVEAQNSVYPRDARETAWRLRRLQGSVQEFQESAGAIPVIACRSLSPGAREFLRSESVGYYEEGGNMFLPGTGIYILLEKPPSRKASRTHKNLFSGRRSQVLLALLQGTSKWYGVKQLSGLAAASPAAVSQALAELERREWVVSRGKGPHKERKVSSPGTILDAWSKHIATAQKPETRRFFVPSVRAEELLRRIHQVCADGGITYGITGEWAAQLYAPFLSSITQVRCRITPGDSSTLLAGLNAREVSEGSNFILPDATSPGDFLFRQQHRGIWLANPVSVYLDLVAAGGRSGEMAEHLRRERIGF